MHAKIAQAKAQAARDRQRRLHAINRERAAGRRLLRKLQKSCRPRR